MADTTEGYLKTTTQNFISRQATIGGAKQVQVKGRSVIHHSVKVRGDLAIVRIGRYTEVGAGTVLEPPVNPLFAGNKNKDDDGKKKHIPMTIGSHTTIGENCVINAAAIGSMVQVGASVKLGQRCIIKDCVILEDGVELGDDTVIPPFTRISKDKKADDVYDELPPSTSQILQESSMDRFQAFQQSQRQQ